MMEHHAWCILGPGGSGVPTGVVVLRACGSSSLSLSLPSMHLKFTFTYPWQVYYLRHLIFYHPQQGFITATT